MKKWQKRVLWAGAMMATGGLIGAAILPVKYGFVAGKAYGAVKGWQVGSALGGAASSFVSVESEKQVYQHNTQVVACAWCGMSCEVNRDVFPKTEGGVDLCMPHAQQVWSGEIPWAHVQAIAAAIREAKAAYWRQCSEKQTHPLIMMFTYAINLNSAEWRQYERQVVEHTKQNLPKALAA